MVLLCKWGRQDATTFGDVYYAASLTSPGFGTVLLKVEVDGANEMFFPVSIPPQQYAWFTYLRLRDIIFRGDGCYRITISGARYGIPVHLSSSYITSVGFILRRRLLMDKINRPPLQCTVVRSEKSTKLSPASKTRREKGTVVIASGGSIPTPIRAHLEKVSKMRIFEGSDPTQLRQ